MLLRAAGLMPSNELSVHVLNCRADKEAKLLAELDAWGPPDRLPTAADMEQFPYAAACFQESLRLFPPAAAAVREAPAGGIQLGGLSVPAGTALQVGGRGAGAGRQCGSEE